MENTMFTMSMPIDLKRAIRKQANKDNTSMAELVVKAIEKHLKEKGN